MMENTAEYFCAYCGEGSITFIDLSEGFTQSYIEDCQVCCRPNRLFITVDEETLEISIDTDVTY
ncbi:MAG: CPXCG motif-containing cysteine-rich protein [Synechococcus sp.]|nr:CPXCG motif-containing cysteine-rich protein [Synechococcus sp.]